MVRGWLGCFAMSDRRRVRVGGLRRVECYDDLEAGERCPEAVVRAVAE